MSFTPENEVLLLIAYRESDLPEETHRLVNFSQNIEDGDGDIASLDSEKLYTSKHPRTSPTNSPDIAG